MKSNLRMVLYVTAAALMFIIWQRWQTVNAPAMQAANDVPVAEQTSADIPSSSTQTANLPSGVSSQDLEQGGVVTVKTDTMTLKIALQGATIIEADLMDYPAKVGEDTPLAILRETNPGRSLLQSGLVGQNGSHAPDHLQNWQSAQKEYVLADGADSLSVPFVWQSEDGIRVEKVFTFKRGAYDFDLKQTLHNQSDKSWQGFAYEQVLFGQAVGKKGFGSVGTFTGGVMSTPDDRYQKIDLSDIAKNQMNKQEAKEGWIAMMQHYFLAAIIPSTSPSYFYTRANQQGDHFIGTQTANVTVGAGNSHVFSSQIYVGPKIAKNLKKVAPYLDKTIDYGWLFMISDVMFGILEMIHSIVKNWGWSIVLMTLLIKGLFFVPSAWAYKSMAKMRALQPELAALKDRYGDDRQGMSQAMMKLYKDNKVNPASGCLPMLLQIPFFIAFYWVLAESVQLRQAAWIGWIHDLSVMDPYFILPIINAGLMFLQQKLNPPPPDPMQAKVMMMMPIIFGVMFMWFPSGLVLYWTVSNAFSIVQQSIMNKRYGHAQRPHNYHPKRS